MLWRDTLEHARSAQFIGRTDEVAFFKAALQPDTPAALLFTGSPGTGKTSLLRHLAAEARAAGLPAYSVGLSEAATPETLLAAVEAETPLRLQGGLLADPDTPDASYVLLLDGLTTALGGYVLTRLLPTLPGAARIVLACPEAPEVQRTDPALRRLVRVLPLGPLHDDEAQALLASRGVPEAAHKKLLLFAQGHPAALALGAEACVMADSPAFDPTADPDLVAALAAQYLDRVEGREARMALYAGALVRTLNEPLLATMLDVDDAYARFEALRKLPFVHAREGGLTLDPFARTVLVSDLRWRNADLHATLHRRVRGTYARRLADPADQDHGSVLSDYLFLLRDNPIVQPFFGMLMHEDGRLVAGQEPETQWRPTVARPPHYAEVLDIVRRHEGEASARWAEYWLRVQPAATTVYLDARGRVGGLLTALALDPEGPDPAGDPAVAAACSYLRTQAPLRKGERGTLFRFWMSTDAYQDVSPLLGIVFADTVRHYLTTPRLAFSFLPFADADAWGLVMAVAGLTRLPETDFEVGEHRYGVFAQDWRRVPPADWLDRIARFGLAPEPPEANRTPRLLLDREAFADAVRLALRDFTAPEALQRNPLLDARIGAERRGQEAPVEILRRLLREAAAPLAGAPRTAKQYRALEATYFDPAPTQEQAAERLDVPFSTYRRHLRAGQDAVVEALWTRELGTPSNAANT